MEIADINHLTFFWVKRTESPNFSSSQQNLEGVCHRFALGSGNNRSVTAKPGWRGSGKLFVSFQTLPPSGDVRELLGGEE